MVNYTDESKNKISINNGTPIFVYRNEGLININSFPSAIKAAWWGGIGFYSIRALAAGFYYFIIILLWGEAQLAKSLMFHIILSKNIQKAGNYLKTNGYYLLLNIK
jgi:hypothetical protein